MILWKRVVLFVLCYLHLAGRSVECYQCICNYSDDSLHVYGITDSSSVPVGYLEYRQCKLYLYPTSVNSTDFNAIMFHHQVAFVSDRNLTRKECKGQPSINDTVTAMIKPSTEATNTTRPTELHNFPTKLPLPELDKMSTIKTTTKRTGPFSLAPSMISKTTKSSLVHTTVSESSQTMTLTTIRENIENITEICINTTDHSIALTAFTDKENGSSRNQSATTYNIIQGHLELCSSRIQQAALRNGAILAQFGDNCYEVDQSSVSWRHAESICHQHGGHLAHISNQKEQDFIYNFLVKHHSHTAWIGLNDKTYEENFEWSSGDPITYTNWKQGRKNCRYHNSEDCVFMSQTTGEWDDTQCGGDGLFAGILFGHQHAYICQYATVHAPTASTLNTALDGNVNSCGAHLINQASKDAGTLAQYGHSCYEVVPNTQKAWSEAESFCHSRGGHLAHISNAQQQSFIQGFLERYSPKHAVWIGLTDKHTEGNFHWTSGNAVQYTHWVPGHISNFVHHSQEDCVVFIPYKNGQWDDIPCGNTIGFLNLNVGEVHPLLCQYRLSAGPSIIG